METRTERIARLEAEADDQRQQIALHNARLGAILKEIELLRRGADVVDVEEAGTLKQAVLAVLRDFGEPMAPAEVTAVLQQRGREVHVPSIRGTLNSLKKDGLVTRAGSKQWVAL